jgi:hypothetical protein
MCIPSAASSGWERVAVARATNGDIVYIFEIDPAVEGADYTVSDILAEAFPDEATSLYERYAGSGAGTQHVVSLTLIAELGRVSP